MNIWQKDTIKYADQDLRDADLAALGRDRNLALACLAAAMHRAEHELGSVQDVGQLRRAVDLTRRAADAVEQADYSAAHLDIVDARRTLAAIRW
jgi:hypothetical protein